MSNEPNVIFIAVGDQGKLGDDKEVSVPFDQARALIAGEAVIVPVDIINKARCFLAGLEGALDHAIKLAGKERDKQTMVEIIRERTEVREFKEKLKAITERK